MIRSLKPPPVLSRSQTSLIKICKKDFFWNFKAKHLSRSLDYEPTDQISYLIRQTTYITRTPSSAYPFTHHFISSLKSHASILLTARNPPRRLEMNQSIPEDTCVRISSKGKKEIRLLPLIFFNHLNLDVQRPMTSPWQTSSALNSDPSRVR